MRERRGQLALIRPIMTLVQVSASLAVALAQERHETAGSCTKTGR